MGPAEEKIRFLRGHDGVRLACATSGQGPTVIKAATWLSHLAHDGSSPVWRHLLGQLSARHRLVRYDERGCGLSDWNVPDLGFESWACRRARRSRSPMRCGTRSA
jgi:pimeloyl-ACP methyl ester carboxylesterase